MLNLLPTEQYSLLYLVGRLGDSKFSFSSAGDKNKIMSHQGIKNNFTRY